ncbi:MAG: DHH family phosphoesterase [Caldicoprobacter sp.]|uniref:DHH family phosphoesterase n=1 Tax=Caldicoprobacter sp. TaxID=2004500 RepID=UPI0039C381BD
MKKPTMKGLNVPENPIYLAVILVLSSIICYFNWGMGLAAFLLFIYLVYYNWKVTRIRRVEWTRYLENLSENIDWSTKNAVFSVPMPFVVVELDGTINWYNPRFGQLFEGESLLGKNIKNYIPNLDIYALLKNKEDDCIQIELNGRTYRLFYTPLGIGDSKEDGRRVIVFLYLQDITQEALLKVKYHDERPVVMLVQVDNYDEVVNNTDEAKRPVVMAEIESILSQWAISLNAGWKKFDRDKFVVFAEARALKALEDDKFSILDAVRSISAGNRIPVTLSIGVGVDGKNPLELSHYAQFALDLALGRGGDQAVVKRGTKLFFYGGKSKEVEKRTKVKSRVIANALKELMSQSWGVFIMGHEAADLDCLGAALGIYRCARHIGKRAYIVMSRPNPSIRPMISRLMEDEEYRDVFITPDEALTIADRQAVVVVVDVHRPAFMEEQRLLNAVDKVVVIDHHRRSAEAVENATLVYLEPYASSTSELVTEIVQYFDEKVELKPVEADALLAGITVDTKNFIFKTGVRTFEAASYLRRAGADPASVRHLFQDDLETFLSRAEVVKNAQIIAPGVALAYCPPDIKNGQLIAAQAADSLLTIKGIHTSFVLYANGDDVMISGRSLGNVNVQMVLEKLGGGGHLTVAGAQLGNISLDEARQKVIKALKDYLEEGNKR